MANSFSTILIPVDITTNTDVAVEKGMELAGDGTTIHLLHIMNTSRFGVYLRACLRLVRPAIYRKLVVQKIARLHQQIQNAKPEIEVYTTVNMGHNTQRAIREKAATLKPDLIIIGKHTQSKLFSIFKRVTPAKIVQLTGVPVLTVRPGCIQNNIRTVVIPITSISADNKMKMIGILSKKYQLKVYLVTFLNSNEPDDAYAEILLNAYRWLQEIIHCSVDYTALHGENRAEAFLVFARKVNADFLLLYPGSETRIGWHNHIADVLRPISPLQVLMIQPSLTIS